VVVLLLLADRHCSQVVVVAVVLLLADRHCSQVVVVAVVLLLVLMLPSTCRCLLLQGGRWLGQRQRHSSCHQQQNQKRQFMAHAVTHRPCSSLSLRATRFGA